MLLNRELSVVNSKASTLYNTVKACVDGVGCLTGETEFDAAMQKETDYDKLLQIWKTWYIRWIIILLLINYK